MPVNVVYDSLTTRYIEKYSSSKRAFCARLLDVGRPRETALRRSKSCATARVYEMNGTKARSNLFEKMPLFSATLRFRNSWRARFVYKTISRIVHLLRTVKLRARLWSDFTRPLTPSAHLLTYLFYSPFGSLKAGSGDRGGLISPVHDTRQEGGLSSDRVRCRARRKSNHERYSCVTKNWRL